MKKYKNNIILDYIQLGLRSFNVTNVIWLLYLLLKGFDPLEIGIFESVFHVSSLLFEIPSGMLADLIGRKQSRIIGVLLYLVYVILIVYGNNVVLIGLAFIFCGASYAFESGSGEALIYDSLVMTNDQDKFMKINGNREIIFQLSSTLALLIGGYLALMSYKLNFLVVFIAFTVALIPVLLMKETKQNSVKKHSNFNDLVYEHFVRSTKTVFNDKNLTFLIILGALLAAPVTSIFFYFQLYLSESLNYPEYLIGILLAVHSLAGALGGYLASRLEKKFQEKLLLYIVPLLLVVSFWAIQVDLIVFVPFVLLGFLDSLLYIVLSDYVNRIIPSEQRATVLSFSSFAFSIVMIIIFPILGAIAKYSSYKISFLILAGLVSVLYVALLLVLRSNKFVVKKGQ
ncbi:Inner membrane transport protein YdhC [Candidatus Izimaplasma bacterium HR1]|jgi:MFS family permease|uniref:MFS transporter n=1 Tax=Candidatus Izimoplasma sp. HR1 TaxID=1541959 RepID=UPI0004F92A1F|nr:Inner membrane transport protein YdhC [Candidatus Izimaplasma bacterium HR1]